MQPTIPTPTTTALSTTRWTGTVPLRRTPICPRCGYPIRHNGWAVIAGVVFCSRCSQGTLVACLKDAQFLRTHYPGVHVTERNGLLFYTPTTTDTHPLATLAEQMQLACIYAILPITPTGEHITLAEA